MLIEYKSNGKELWSEEMQFLGKKFNQKAERNNKE